MLGAMVPETKYAKSGDVHIAYQVLGQGPIDLIFIPLSWPGRTLIRAASSNGSPLSRA